MDGRYQERGKLALWSTGFLLLPVVLRRARLWTAFLNEMKQVWSLMGVILGFGVAGFAECKCLVSGVGVFTCHCNNQLMAPIRGEQQQLRALGSRANRMCSLLY